MLLSTSKSQAERIADAVAFVEAYEDRLKALFGNTINWDRPSQSFQPCRGILLQDCWGGQDALVQLIGRNDAYNLPNFLVSILGVNSSISPSGQTFQLQVIGIPAEVPSPVPPGWVTLSDGTVGFPLGTTPSLDFSSDAATVQDALAAALLIDRSFVFVGLGNPYYSVQLVPYGNVILPPAGSNVFALSESYVGAWHIHFDQDYFNQWETLSLIAINPSITGLSGLLIQEIEDSLSSEVTIATDPYYRPASFPWQAGTIVTMYYCMDTGWTIASSSYRQASFIPPVGPTS